MNRHPILYSVLIVSILCVLGFIFLMGLAVLVGPDEAVFFGQARVAVVKIEGTILDAGDTLKTLQKYSKNDAIKAIVVRVDSPGGAVAPSQEIYAELKKLKPQKKIVVSMGTVAASGGYYIASAADKIVASPGTITGSIGVIMKNFGLQDLIKWAHVENRVIKTGKFKDAGDSFREMTLEEKAYLRTIIEDMYTQFKDDVAGQRGFSAEKMEELAQGRIYTGKQALEAGLVDQLGTIYDAIDLAKRLAKLDSDAKVAWPRAEKLPLEELLFDSQLMEKLQGMLYQAINQFQYPASFYLLGS